MYKVGQKVKIKREEERDDASLYKHPHKDFLEKNNYIGIIEEIDSGNKIFKLQGFEEKWATRSIMKIISKPPIKAIDSRWEILDLELRL